MLCLFKHLISCPPTRNTCMGSLWQMNEIAIIITAAIRQRFNMVYIIQTTIKSYAGIRLISIVVCGSKVRRACINGTFSIVSRRFRKIFPTYAVIKSKIPNMTSSVSQIRSGSFGLTDTTSIVINQGVFETIISRLSSGCPCVIDTIISICCIGMIYRTSNI